MKKTFVRTWHNGKPNRKTGSGFGLKIAKVALFDLFHRGQKQIKLLLEGEAEHILVNVN
jgi:hypothetical protein